MEHLVSEYVQSIKHIVLNDSNFPMADLVSLASQVVDVFLKGNKIAFLGNGGSAAEAIHLAAEFTGKCVIDHDPWPALCLNESQSSITAVGNDYGFERIFERQVRAHMRHGDILICLSTSGKSPNITNAIEAALKLGCVVFLWTGAGYNDSPQGLNVWKVDSLQTPRIQEIHLMWGHILSELVEQHGV